VRVLCISTDYPPHGHGGYEQQCRDLCEHLRGQGHRVVVLSGEAPGDGDRRCGVLRELPRFPVDPAPVAPHAARREERRAASALARTLASFRPDVAGLWRLGELAMSLPARLAAAGVPTVGMVCDPWMIDGPLRDPWARLRSATPALAAALARATGGPLPPRFGGAARWLLVSDVLRRQLVARGVTVRGSDVVPSGIDLRAFPLVAPGRGAVAFSTPAGSRRSRASISRSGRWHGCRRTSRST
jgi:glycosyltransferase involved in cell wall biosynthesis